MIDLMMLKKICEEFINREVEITYSTYSFLDERLREFISAIVYNPSHADIAIFAHKCKDDKMVLKAIAHELAHVLANTIKHGKKFQNKWVETEKSLSEKYYRGETVRACCETLNK